MSNLLNTHILIRLHHDILTSVNAIQGDTGRLWYFQIEDYEVPSDAEIRMYIRKPSGKEIYNSGILKDNIISFQPTLQTLAETGQSIGQIQIISNDLSVTTFPFFLNVTENYRLTSSIVSENEFLVLDELIKEAREVISEMDTLIKSVTSQENARVEAEKKRVSAEKARVSAENTRKTAETSRVNSEKARVTAETSRVEAEKLRQQNTSTAITKANNAANNANSKATLANNAASKAEAATKKATDAAANINIIAITNSQIDSLKNL